jgi:hypothetical protein
MVQLELKSGSDNAGLRCSTWYHPKNSRGVSIYCYIYFAWLTRWLGYICESFTDFWGGRRDQVLLCGELPTSR